MINKQKVEKILNDLVGVNFLEWQMIAEKIDEEFERRRNRIVLMEEDAERIRAGFMIEYGGMMGRED